MTGELAGNGTIGITPLSCAQCLGLNTNEVDATTRIVAQRHLPVQLGACHREYQAPLQEWHCTIYDRPNVGETVSVCIIEPVVDIVRLVVTIPLPSPIVGIPAYRSWSDAGDYAMRRRYVEAIASAGGIPLLIPPLADQAQLRQAYDLADGLLLAGGGDVAAGHYGSTHTENLRLVDIERDEIEIRLIHWAVEDGLPILAICRGIQVLNVAGGGSLIQDIPTEVEGALGHYADGALPRSHVAHPVFVKPGSLLAKTVCDEQPVLAEAGGNRDSPLGVNSYHHQAVLRLAPGYSATAHAPDGIIEGIEPEERRHFVLGVQWHPECMVPGDAAMERLFSGFVAACRLAATSRPVTCQRGEVRNGNRSFGN